MPRSRRSFRAQPHRPLNMGALASMARTVSRFGEEYSVSRVRGNERSYTCPACLRQVPPYTAHMVVWKNTGLTEYGPDFRRHWHLHCWERGLRPQP